MITRETIKDNKDERLNLRLTLRQKDLIESAAELNSQTVNTFALEAVLKKSREVIKEHQEATLSLEEAHKLLEILEQPSEPNAVLIAARERYKNTIHD